MKQIKKPNTKNRWLRFVSITLLFAMCLNTLPKGEIGKHVIVKAASWEADDKTTDVVKDWDDDVRVISDEQDLIALSKERGSFAGETIVLNADIKLSKLDDFKGICLDSSYPFKGTFDGCGHSISGINISAQTRAGLFGYIGRGGVVRNVIIEDSQFSYKGDLFYAGAIVAKMTAGTIQNCHVKNTQITETSSGTSQNLSKADSVCLGGIVGYAERGGRIVNCTFDGKVSGLVTAGGILGYALGQGDLEIINCANYGTIQGGKRATGGIVGWGNMVFAKNCFNTGAVTGTKKEELGTLAGKYANVENCYALEGSCENIDSDCVYLTQEEMKNSNFAEQLNQNIGNNKDYLPWIFEEGKYPHLKEIVNVQKCNISLADGTVVYNGLSQEPALLIQYGAEKLTADQDYTKTYFHNTAAGTASVRIAGKGYFTGSRVFTFDIEKGKLSDCQIMLNQREYTYCGEKITPRIKVMNKKNIALQEGQDFMARYEENTMPGTGKVIVAGMGNYEGTVEKTFRIVEKADSTKNSEQTTVSAVTGLKAKALKGKLKISWAKAAGVSGYEIQYSLKSNFKKVKKITVAKASTKAKTIKGLKKKKKYFVRIRAYKKSGSKKIYGAWTKIAKKTK